MSWSSGGSLMPCEGAAAIDFIFTSTHITVSHITASFFFCPCLIRALERHSDSVGSHKVIPSPMSSTVLFDFFWASLHHLRTNRDADERDCLLIISFAVMMSFWVCLYTRVGVCLCLRSVCAHRCLHMHVFYVGWRFIPLWLRDITAIYWATRDWAHWDFHRASRRNVQISCSCIIKQTLRSKKIELGWSENHRTSLTQCIHFQNITVRDTLFTSRINVKQCVGMKHAVVLQILQTL